MIDFDEKLSQLQARLEKMAQYQEYFRRETTLIRDELNLLKQSVVEKEVETQTEVNPQSPIADYVPPIIQPSPPAVLASPAGQPKPLTSQPSVQNTRQNPVYAKLNLEELIGRNLISVVGIIITIIGVGIGAKYAIDNDLISPAMRILAGYLFGVGLFGIAIWLKPKYLNFSAVLLSGAMAILYFITFFADSFYGLMPQTLAFLLMLLITIATVAAAINYNRQIIAHIGLVGAYAVPFLLSNNAGNTGVLFGYVAVINFGVLAVSIRKYWKPLFYSSFVLTWIIYSAGFLSGYLFQPAAHFSLFFGFASLFFLTFYSTFLAYKLVAKERFGAENVLLLLANSFVFYGFGYALVQNQPNGDEFLGLFTIFNAALHFVVAGLVKRYAFIDKGNLSFLTALGLVFVTLAVPVELRGHWMTLLWTAEAANLFWLGRAQKLSLYERFAYPLMILASISLLNDWIIAADRPAPTAFFNNGFLTGILFVAGFASIIFIEEKYRSTSTVSLGKIAKFAIWAIFLTALYNTFRIEIGNYFAFETVHAANNPVDGSEMVNNDWYLFNFIWQLNYSMFFLTALLVVNRRKIKSDVLGFIGLGLTVIVLLTFLTGGLFALSQLTNSYVAQTGEVFYLLMRYISLVFVAGLIFAVYRYLKESLSNRFPQLKLNLGFDFTFYFSLWWITSSELLNWGEVFRFSDADKLGLSVWWGIYALVLVIVGINRRKKHLRVSAIVLFAFTLVKLFFYDIARVGTIAKTVVFVSLGILLLVISFLYNKYKQLIFDQSESAAIATDSK